MKRIILGGLLVVAATVFLMSVVSPAARQLEALTGSFVGALFLSSPEGHAALQHLMVQRLVGLAAMTVGLVMAGWGWHDRRRGSSR